MTIVPYWWVPHKVANLQRKYGYSWTLTRVHHIIQKPSPLLFLQSLQHSSIFGQSRWTAEMSSSANPRSVAYNERRPTASNSAKPRVTSSQQEERQKPGSSGEVFPDDSASNAPHKKNASGSQRINSYSRNTSERQTEKVQSQVTTRETVQIRTRSPVKSSGIGGIGMDGRSSKARDLSRMGSPSIITNAVPKKARGNRRK